MSKARWLRKMAKKTRQSARPRFAERLRLGLLQTIAWANGEIPLRVTVVTETSRTVKFYKAGELNDNEA